MREIDFSPSTMKDQSERLSREARRWIVPRLYLASPPRESCIPHRQPGSAGSIPPWRQDYWLTGGASRDSVSQWFSLVLNTEWG